MNLQISYIIIFRIKHDQVNLQDLEDVFNAGIMSVTTSMTVVGFFSIMSLLLTFTLELLDVKAMIEIFLHVRRNVKETVFEHGSSSKAFALKDFVVDEDESNRVLHSTAARLETLWDQHHLQVARFLRSPQVLLCCAL